MLKKSHLTKFSQQLSWLSVLGLILTCFILPNSLIIASAIFLTTGFLCAITAIKIDTHLLFVLKFWLANAIVTLIYICVGIFNEASFDAAIQIFMTYIISPLFWIFVLNYLLNKYALDDIFKAFVYVSVLAVISIALFYYFYTNYGADAIRFLISTPYVEWIGGLERGDRWGDAGIAQIGGNRTGIKMHVFGSLIFFVGGYVAAFSFFEKNKIHYFLLFIFIVVTLISGRSALVLSMFIGIIINIISLKNNTHKLKTSTFIKNIFWLILLCFFIAATLNWFDLKFDRLINPLIEKITSQGGEGRRQQLDYLVDGIISNYGLGSGHGISVAYTTGEFIPWSYEMVWVASVFRVGIIGAAIYAASFFYAIFLGLQALFKGTLNKNELFILGGGIGAFMASNTNQYIEAFVFQWMYVLPVLYFTKNKFRFPASAINGTASSR